MTKNISVVRRSNNRKNASNANKPKSRFVPEDSGVQTVDQVESEERNWKKFKLFHAVVDNECETWAPGTSIAFKILVSLRMSAGIWSPLSDCDEVYNYWEPLHLLLYGSGFQTWEYSPTYAIRSYAYIWLHALPARIFQYILPNTKVTTFFFLRCFLGFCSAVVETYLYRTICEKFGNSVGRLFLVFSALGTGMFVASCAFLPSSFSMILTGLTLALWLERRYFAAVLSVAVSALVGWPFAAILGIPVALDMIFSQKRYWQFAIYSAISGWMVCTALIAIDSHYYGKWVLAPLNIVLYNVFTSHGPTLYGTAPWSYYLLNCLLNWNLVFLLAMVGLCGSFGLAVITWFSGKARNEWKWLVPVLYVELALFTWLAIFFLQPHKEERFLFPVYPMFCVSGALALETIHQLVTKLFRDERRADVTVAGIVITFLLISVSRTVSLYKNYHAPFDAYMSLNERLTQNMPEDLPAVVKVCVGKEWYRFPSSFFLPDNLSGNKSVELEFIKSEFAGLLPKRFENVPLPETTRLIPSHMNDMNREEVGRYVEVDKCHYLIDLESPQNSDLEPNFSILSEDWRVVHSDKFLVASRSNKLLRAFFIPFFSHMYCFFGSYNVLERPYLQKEE